MSKVLWEQNSSNFFYAQKLFPVKVSGSGRYSNQNLLWYDQRPSYIILLKQGNFGVSKLWWAYNGFKFIFGRFFRLCEIGSKSCFTLAGISFYDQNWIQIGKLVVCEGFKDIPSNQENISFLMKIIFIWKLLDDWKDFAQILEANGKSICLDSLPPIIHWWIPNTYLLR